MWPSFNLCSNMHTVMWRGEDRGPPCQTQMDALPEGVDHFPICCTHQFCRDAGAGQLSCLCVAVRHNESKIRSMIPVTQVLIFAMNYSASCQNAQGHPSLAFSLIDVCSCWVCARTWNCTVQLAFISNNMAAVQATSSLHELAQKIALSSEK